MSTTSENELKTVRDWAKELVSSGSIEEIEKSFVQPKEPPVPVCREAQNALRVARITALEAISSAHIINKVEKISTGKALTGRFTHAAQSSLRSALLFAGAGLDRSLKQLVDDTMPYLAEFEPKSIESFHKFAEDHISSGSGGIDAKSLVRILLGEGKSPKGIVLNRWSQHLQSSSAQSVERVEEIAIALGVTDRSVRSRIKPGKADSATLKDAFSARNEIAHELDITKPKADVRARLETLQKGRSIAEIEKFVKAIIDIGQLIINDVGERLRAADYEKLLRTTWADVMRKY
ncbi:hypothetical protein [Amycolatopsis sp. NPDC057786]|uniref:hypothetical protein n=1 Tax=Amycolatopsis sp. NPDC057786 TaxID=3346250 RepID=UPI00366B2BF2